jgi:hypothetical protein
MLSVQQACCTKREARSAPGRDTRSGQGALADRRHTDGPLCAALLKTTVMCEAWRRRTSAPPPDPSLTSSLRLRQERNSPHNSIPDTDIGAGPIPPVTVSRVNAYSGGVLARAERVCCLLVLNTVTSTPQGIRQPKPRGCVFVFVCKYVLGRSRAT